MDEKALFKTVIRNSKYFGINRPAQNLHEEKETLLKDTKGIND